MKTIYTILAMLCIMTTAACAQNNRSKTVLPEEFLNTGTNAIGNPECLAPFWEKILKGDTVKVMQVGDSHVAGKYLPNTIGERITERFGAVKFDYLCKIGVQINWFLKAEQYDKIGEYKPDLLIVSLGTNEAHGNFYPSRYQNLMAQFVHIVDSMNPGTTIMFTTQPGSHWRDYGYRTVKGKNGKKTKQRYITNYRANDVNDSVTNCQIDYCTKNGHAYWDMYNLVGGKAEACSNWRKTGLIRGDMVHYTPEGYTLQANLFCDALEEAFDKYRKENDK